MTPSSEKRQLIAEAQSLGLLVSPRQIDRWREAGLIPRPPAVSGGRGAGVTRPTPPGTLRQIELLQKLLAQDRSFNRAALRLWLAEFDISIQRVREALDSVAPASVKAEDLASGMNEFAERLERRGNASTRVRDFARNGQLQALFETFSKVLGGKAVAPEEARAAAGQLEAVIGVDRGRTETLSGVDPWLQADPIETFDMLRELGDSWISCVREATDGQLMQARSDYRQFEKVVTFVEFLEKTRGANSFGFGALTKSPFGTADAEHKCMMFVMILYLSMQKPELTERIGTMADVAEHALNQIQSAMDAQGVTIDQLRAAFGNESADEQKARSKGAKRRSAVRPQ
jgi:hypothetical protein